MAASSKIDINLEFLNENYCLAGDSEGEITSAVYLPDNRLLVVDRMNSKIKILNCDSGKCSMLLDCKGLPSKPVGKPATIALNPGSDADGQVLLIAYPHEHCSEIRLYRFHDDRLDMFHTIQIQNEWVRAADFLDKGRLVIAKPKSVDVIGMNGKVETGNSCPRNRDRCTIVAVRREENTFYFGDYDFLVGWNYITRMRVFRKKFPILKKIRGIAFYADGNVFICGDESHNMVLSDLSQTEVLLPKEDTTNTDKHYGEIGINRRKDQMFVHAYGRQPLQFYKIIPTSGVGCNGSRFTTA